MAKSHNQINALKKAAQDKHHNTVVKAQTTLRIMQETNIPISFESVAKLSGVSKTWLYKQSNIVQLINTARSKTGCIQRVLDTKSALAKKDKIILHLKEKNTHLKNQVKQLKEQLEIVYGEMYNMKKE